MPIRTLFVLLVLTAFAGCRESSLPKGSRAVFSPDGRRLAFEAERAGIRTVGVFDLKRGTTEWIESGSGAAVQPAWLPDGSLVYSYLADDKTAYEAVRLTSEDGLGLRLRTKDGTRDLTHGRWRDYLASASADGRRILFTTTRDQPTGNGQQYGASIWEVDLADGHAKPLLVNTTQNAGYASPAESPCGRFLAWAGLNAFRDCWRIYLGRRDDLSRTLCVNLPTMTAFAPKWSPCGRYLAFAGCDAGDPGWCVYLLDIRAGTQAKVGRGEYPSFSPDGRRLVCDVDGQLVFYSMPPSSAFHPLTLPSVEAGRTILSLPTVPEGGSVHSLPPETAFGTKDFWVSFEATVDGKGAPHVSSVKGSYRTNANAFSLNIGNKGRYPGAFFISRGLADEWCGAGPTAYPPTGRHVFTGFRRTDGLYVFIDGKIAAYMPHKNGVLSLEGPQNLTISSQAGARIHSVQMGVGWPPSVPCPLVLTDFAAEKEVSP